MIGLESAERLQTRINFFVWIAGLPSIMAAVLSGWWAQMHDAPWPLVALTAFGGLCFVLLISAGLFFGIYWIKYSFENRELELRQAARIMYERLQHTAAAAMAEREGKTPDGILEWLGGHLVLHSPVSAERLPSKRHLELSEDDRRYLRVTDGCRTLAGIMGNPVRYANPTIKKKDLEQSIEFLKALCEPITETSHLTM